MDEKMCKWLEQWFLENQAEEDGGSTTVKINTTENSGWSVRINLEASNIEKKEFNKLFYDKGEDDWILCEVKDGFFYGIGDERKLTTILNTFKDWVES